jgi:hypothetical protein
MAKVWMDRADELGEVLATVRFATCVPIRDSLAHEAMVGASRGPGDSVTAEDGLIDDEAVFWPSSGPLHVPARGARTSPAISRSAAESPRSTHLERRRGPGVGPEEGGSSELPDTLSLEIPSPHSLWMTLTR